MGTGLLEPEPGLQQGRSRRLWQGQGTARLACLGWAHSSSDGPADLSCLKPFVFFWLRKRVTHANNRNEMRKKFL